MLYARVISITVAIILEWVRVKSRSLERRCEGSRSLTSLHKKFRSTLHAPIQVLCNYNSGTYCDITYTQCALHHAFPGIHLHILPLVVNTVPKTASAIGTKKHSCKIETKIQYIHTAVVVIEEMHTADQSLKSTCHKACTFNNQWWQHIANKSHQSPIASKHVQSHAPLQLQAQAEVTKVYQKSNLNTGSHKASCKLQSNTGLNPISKINRIMA